MTREQWLEERKNGIGASEAAAILGLSPYKTNVRLWEEKTGRREPEDISLKPFVAYGTKAEEHIRGLYALDHPEYIVKFEPFKMVKNPTYPFIFASPDGELFEPIQQRTGILEIKTCDVNNSEQWKKWDKRVPDTYFVQVIHQLLAGSYDFAVLSAKLTYTDKNIEKCSLIKPPYDFDRASLKADLDYLLEKEIVFWDCVKNDKRPALILPEI